jgi:guanine deaminase
MDERFDRRGGDRARQGFDVRTTIMQTPEPGVLDVQRDVVVSVGPDGVIEAITAAARFESTPAPTADVRPLVALPTSWVLLPGLIDTHAHAPQWPQIGTRLDVPLEEWLFTHTFPLERSLTDPAAAEPVWQHLVSTLLAHGTTTAVYYATTSVDSTTLLAQTCAVLGQRAWIGRVAMDHPDGTPPWYRDESAEAGVADSATSIEQIRAIGSSLVQPVVTPRFAPACTDELLAGLGELAAATDTIVQTHCSESDWEHGYAYERFGTSDTQALHSFGLVRAHSLLGHGTHLSDTDLDLIVDQGAGVTHCPQSNTYFANAVFRARRALDRAVRIGLGSDIAGGSRPGLLGQCADAVSASRHLAEGVDASRDPAERGVAGSRIGILDAFWMATTGAADLLGAPVGLIAPGRHFDAIAVDLEVDRSALRMWPGEPDDAATFERIVRLASPAEIVAVWVDGVQVDGVQVDAARVGERGQETNRSR